MDAVEQNQVVRKPSACFERTFSLLTVDDVYEIAKQVGYEVERLIDSCGAAGVQGLVSKIVKVLEHLESFVVRNQTQSAQEEDLLKAFESLQEQQKRRSTKECESHGTELRDWQQKEQKWQLRLEEVQAQVLQLQEENQELQGHLQSSLSKEDHSQRQEREVMIKLKEVVDKQRDELRAKVQEISNMSKEVEALQEQLDRFLKMNSELRHRQGLMEAQLRSAVETRAHLETDLCEKHKEIQRLTTQLEQSSTAIDLTDKMIVDLKDPNRPCFTKQEVRDMLFERNELKANLFLVQEELAYYQREILNEERCPGFLLEAVRTAIKKQRTVIKAKMLGIPQDICSSTEEPRPSFEQRDTVDNSVNCTDSKPAESRIRNLFGFLTRPSSASSRQESSPVWEIINPDEQEPEKDAEP
ncbi:RILP-like protein 1 isoform X2 [Electrophorus electricus]|uniref:RILP-like protein 1 isoform X2 n=1 Tax=Electrophorus electricus TaxID=8005 RepID=UPI0015CFA42E|nr:RILP-like protein 1 isoform X2 [Electrophorus electricus]